MKTIVICFFLLTVLGSCEKSEATNNVVPAAAFDFSKKGSLPIVASFISTSTGTNPVVAFMWNFGDPGSGINNTSAIANPIHEYYAEGVYTVMLTTTDNMGQQSVATMTLGASLRTALVEPNDANFVYSLTASYPYVVTFNNNSTNSTNNNWNFGDGLTAVNDSAVVHHAYLNPGSYEVTLIASSNGGSDTALATINIP